MPNIFTKFFPKPLVGSGPAWDEIVFQCNLIPKRPRRMSEEGYAFALALTVPAFIQALVNISPSWAFTTLCMFEFFLFLGRKLGLAG